MIKSFYISINVERSIYLVHAIRRTRLSLYHTVQYNVHVTIKQSNPHVYDICTIEHANERVLKLHTSVLHNHILQM